MYSRKIDKCENKSLEYTKLGLNLPADSYIQWVPSKLNPKQALFKSL